MDKDIVKTLEKYPLSELCDEWESCVDYHDRYARDMYCKDCDTYWEFVELVEKGEIDLRDISEWKRICEICGTNYIDT